MVTPEDVISIYRRLLNNGIPIWLSGGWGIDALLGRQTRPHKDMDVIVLLDDVMRLRELLRGEGYELKEVWSENRQATDRQGVETATAFVLQDAAGRELDVHAVQFNSEGNGIPAWEAGELILRREDVAGIGAIAGCTVQCLSAEMQVRCHTGYALPDKQLNDLRLLHEKYGEAIAALVRQLPAERAAQLYDFAHFLLEQSQSINQPDTIDNEEIAGEASAEELAAEDTLWEASMSRHADQFAALKAQAKADVKAKKTFPMLNERGEFDIG